MHSDCATAVKEAKSYGFSCKDSLKAIIEMPIKLVDFCCATCSQSEKPKKTCGAADYKGDGNCDDDNNNRGCAWDGGDCCYKTVKGGKVQKDYCKEVSSASHRPTSRTR